MRAVSSTYANNRRLDTHLCRTPSDMKFGPSRQFSSVHPSTLQNLHHAVRNPLFIVTLSNVFDKFALAFENGISVANGLLLVEVVVKQVLFYGPLCCHLVPQLCSESQSVSQSGLYALRGAKLYTNPACSLAAKN